MATKGVILLAALVAGTLAVPVSLDLLDESKCSSHCKESVKFRYQPGTTYSYRYEADTVTSVQGASEEHSSLHIRATANIEVIEPCEMVLKLTDVTLEESHPKDLRRRNQVNGMRTFKEKLELNPLRFAFQDGHIEATCATEGEDEWAQNIKHAVLSAFQNGMDDLETEAMLDEVDIAGNCPTHYTVKESESRGMKTVSRSKNILECLDRNHQQTYVQGTPYDARSPLQSMPILKSTHECEQMIDAYGKLVKTACEEMHMFRPFSNEKSGAVTTSTQVLEFTREFRSRRTPLDSINIVKRTNLKFSHTEAPEVESSNVRDAESILRDLCDKSSDEIRPEVPFLFSKLVYKLRQLGADSLESVLNRASRNPCSKAKTFMHEAIPLLGTTAAVKLIKKKIASNEVEEYTSIWLTMMSLIPKPTSEMLGELKELLDVPQPSHNVMLAVSTLAFSHCKHNPTCEEDPNVRAIVQVFEKMLNYNCKVTPATEDKVIMALKSIGNIGISLRPANLNRCVANRDLPIAVRLAAMEAFRRMPCHENEVRFDSLKDIFRDAQLDSEVRIGAYLMMMKCPTPSMMQDIRSILEEETVNQVGSFVWTHLTNLMETSAPYKQDIRSIVEDELLKKCFDMDKRKFSRNIELSLFSEMLNTGANLESNIIWSQKSFFPRSAMLNLTVDMFGQSVNLFEVGARAEGIQHFLEQMFGPEGYLSNKIPDIGPRRNKRDAIRPQKINKVEDRYDFVAPEAKASAYMRLFGNEIRYASLDSSAKGKFNPLDFLINLASDNTYEFTKSMMFLDSTHCIPTVTGLPLKMAINGTATVNLKVGGKVDIRQLFTFPPKFDIDGFVKPSGAVEVSSTMGVDAFVTKTGLRVVSTLHSSTYAEGKIELQNGQLLNVKVDMPKDKIEVLDVKTRFYILSSDGDREQKMVTSGRVEKEGCTGSTLVDALGIEFCSTISYANASMVDEAPYFPLTGPKTFTLVLNKRDTHTSYEMEAGFSKQKEGSGKSAKDTYVTKLSFNTPGSQADRHLSTELIYKPEDKAFSLNLKSPWKKLDANGEYVNKPDLKRIALEAMVDETKRYAVSSEMQTTIKGATVTYTPSFELHMPNKKAITVKGELIKVAKVKLGMYELNGVLDVNSPYFNGKLTNKISSDSRKGLKSMDVKMDYDDKRGGKQYVRFAGKLKTINNAKITKYTATGNSVISQYPEYNVGYIVSSEYNPTNLKGSAEVKYGAKAKKMISSFEFTRHPSGILTGMTGKCNVKCASKGIDSSFSFEHKKMGDKMDSKLDFALTPRKKGSIDSSIEYNLDDMKVFGDVKLTYPGREMRIVHDLQRQRPGQFKHIVTGQWQKGKEASISSTYQKSGDQHAVDSTITSTSYPGRDIKLMGKLKPNLKDFSINLGGIYDGKGYETDFSYETNLCKGGPCAFKSDVSLKYPERSFRGNVDVLQRGTTHNVKAGVWWDRKNANIDGSIRYNSLVDHDVSLTLKYPGQEIKVINHKDVKDGRHIADTRISWDGERKMFAVTSDFGYEHSSWYHSSKADGKITIRTPYPNFETMTTEVGYEKTTDTIKTNGAFELPRQKFGFDVDLERRRTWKSVRGDITITIPIRQLNPLELSYDHSLTPNSLNVEVDTKYGNNFAKFNLDGTKNARGYYSYGNYRAKAALTTSHRGFEKNELSYTVRYEKTKFSGEISGLWGVNQKSVINVDLLYPGSGLINVQGSVTAATPFYDQIKVAHKLNVQDASIDTLLDVIVGREKKVSFKLNGDIDKRREVSLNGQMDLTTVFKPVRAVSVALQHKHDYRRALTFDSSLVLSHQLDEYRKIKIETELAKNQGFDVEGKMQFTSPFKKFEFVNLEITNKKIRDTYTTKGEMKLGPNTKVNIDSELKIQSIEDMYGQVRFTSTFNRFQRIIASATHKKDGRAWNSEINVEYAPSKKIEVTSSLETSPIKARLEVKSPFKEMKNVLLSVFLDGKLSDFTSKVTIDHNMLKSPISTELESSVSTQNIKIKSKITSPFEAMSSALLNFDYTGPLRNYNVKAILNHNLLSRRISFEHEQDTSNLENIRSHFKLITPYPKLSGESTFTFEGVPKHFDLTYTSTFPQAFTNRDLVINLKSDVRDIHNFIIECNNQFLIDTKYKLLEDVSFKYAHKKVSPNNYECSGFISSGPGGETKIQFLNKLNLASWKDFGEHLEIDSNILKKIEFDLMFKKAQRTEGSFSFTSPLNINDVSARFNHHGDLRRFSTDAEVRYAPNKVINIKADHTKTPKGIKSELVVKTPFQRFKENKVSIEHDGDLNDFTNKASIGYDLGKEINWESAVKHSGSWWGKKEAMTTMKLETPFEIVRNAELSIDHKHSWDNVDNTIEFSRNDQKYLHLESKYDKETEKKHAVDIQLLKPYQMEGKFELKDLGKEKTGQVYVNLNKNKRDLNMKVEYTYKDNSNRFRTSHLADIKAFTPFLDEPKHELHAEFENSRKGLSNKGDFDIMAVKGGYELDWAKLRSGVKTSGKVMLPTRTVALDFEHTTDSNKKTSDVSFMWDAESDPSKKMTFKSDYQTRGVQHNGKVTITHPFLQEGVTVTSDLTLDKDNCNYLANVVVECDREKVEASGKLANTEAAPNMNYTLQFGLKHPVSLLDIDMVGHVASVNDKLSTGASVSYLTTRRQNKVVYLRGEIDKVKKELDLQLLSPVKTMNLVGRMANKDSSYHFELENVTPYTTTTLGELDFDTSPKIDLKIFDPENDRNMLHIYGKYLPKKAIELEAYRLVDGTRRSDSLMKTKLSSSHLLSSRLTWNPDFFSEVKEAINARRPEIMESLQDMKESFSSEMSQRKRLTSRSRAWSNIVEKANTAMNDMYSTNEFFAYDIYQMSRTALDYIRTYSEYTSSLMSELFAKTGEDIRNRFNSLAAKIKYLVEDYSLSLEQGKRYLKETWNRKTDEAAEYMSDMRQNAMESLEAYRNNLNGYLASITPTWYPMNYAFVTYAKDKLSEFLDYVKTHPHTQTVKDWADDMNLDDHIDTFADKYNEILYRVRSKIQSQVQSALSHPHVKYAKELANSAYQQGTWAYEYWQIEETIVDALKQLYNNWKPLAKKHLYNIADQYLHFDEYKVVRFDPQNGEIKVQAHVPFELKDIKLPTEMPNMQKYINKLTNRWENIKRRVASMMPDKDFSLWDTYYSYKPLATNPLVMLPPYDTHALMAGRQHYMTFDKKFYEFAGECSYLLAHDFENNNFSVVVNYKKTPKALLKSILVISNEKQIEIQSDYRVKLDSRKAELPIGFKNTTAVRHGNMIVISNSRGLTVKCDLPHDFCMVYMSGWYHGKTAGLFGTYDNEAKNDWLSPDREPQSTVSDFANSWDVGYQCKSSGANIAVEADFRENSVQYQTCAALFKDTNSPFRPCFKQADPAPFMTMCLNDLELLNKPVSEADTCNTAAAYLTDCKVHGLELSLPKSCVTCKMPNKEVIKQDQEVTLSKKTLLNAVDVVFVIQETECNKKIATNLNKLAVLTTGNLAKMGLRDVQFGLVGFGGEGVHNKPHSHTLDGELFAPKTKLLIGIKSFDFTRPDTKVDGLSALAFASKYPFRAGAAREVILVTCDTCTEGPTTYSEMQHLMLERDISFHVVLDHALAIKTKKKAKSFIYGFDNDEVFTNKHFKLLIKKFKGDTSLRSQILEPKDMCAPLALESNGTVWDRNHLMGGRPVSQKKLMVVMSRALAKGTQPSPCQICDCVPDITGVGMSVCRQCDVPKYNPLSKLSRYNSNIIEPKDDEFTNDLKEFINKPQKPKKKPLKKTPPKKKFFKKKKGAKA
ncbi:unnamed protein product [Owenia fusiformis]|uniref:Uncharacterized protein n=1 Tax=Owenia fusiformis TaxID=6347 RepID=A0A8J1UTN6_OWEFU|nr:unnamed protein product [Owenia fusiformis]